MKRLITSLCLLTIGVWGFSQTTANITVPKTQRGVVTKLAATWCPFCGSEAWDTYKKMVDDLSAKSLVMVAHRSATSRLYSATAEKVLNAYEPVFYQPYFFFNTKLIGEGDATTGSEMKKQVDNFSTSSGPIAQTGMQAKFNPATRELEVTAKTEFFKTATGNYFTGIYVIEKSVIEQQASRSATAQHLNVLRTHLGNDAFGFEIGNGSLASGFSKTISAKTTLATNINANNILIATILWQKTGEGAYSVVNSNWTDQFSATVAVRENQALKADYSIKPNIISEEALVEFNLPNAGKQVLVQAFDLKGRLVKTLFRGSLAAGKHQFQLDRQDLSSKGLYFVRLQVDGQFATRQAVVQ